MVKKLIKTGVVGATGLYAIGTINNLPGMPKNNVTGLASAGVNLSLLGGLTKTAMNVIPRSKKRRR
jgi:hypothetical protein